MGCRVLQSVAVYCNKQSRMCCSVESIAVSCSELQCVVACCSVLQCVAVCCSHLQCIAVCQLRCVALCCNTNVVSFDISLHLPGCSALHCVAVLCSVLQSVTVCCNIHVAYFAMMSATAPHLNESRQTYVSVMSNTKMSHGTHKKESRHIYLHGPCPPFSLVIIIYK